MVFVRKNALKFSKSFEDKKKYGIIKGNRRDTTAAI